ncbi:MAG: NUDIX hydrolase N-terminal domain-containing protein [Chloroflexi bacterium]|nr:NUDIX hydrolase N-terminal domain-containing protein [Chloroflexota bacterium]
MTINEEPRWLGWAKSLQAIAQNGLTFSQNPFEIERYEAVRQVAAEMMAAGSGDELEKVLDLFKDNVGYMTPKVDTRGVVFRDRAILLVKELLDHKWTSPGGWADVNESPSTAVVREIQEEAGFECEITGGAPSESIETSGAAFFREGEIPELSLARVTPLQITRMFEHYRYPEWPTDFD